MRSLVVILAMGLAGVAARAEVTYAKEVSRILAGRCQQCHRPGDIGPMAFMNYGDAFNYAPDIKRVIEEGIMPPWKPSRASADRRGSSR